jgi:hypothetical protein
MSEKCFLRSFENMNQTFTPDDLFLCQEAKAIPLQTWTGPEGSRSLRLPDLKIIGT